MTSLQPDIEQRLAQAEPAVEVLLAEVIGTPGSADANRPAHGTLRIFIDHPDGVTIGLCERVSALLADLRESYTLEVSSPGAERPLTKPDHFRAHIGRRARVRLRGDAPQQQQRSAAKGAAGRRSAETARRGGEVSAAQQRRSFTGELVGASESEVTIAAGEGMLCIPYSQIRRCNLVGE